jgi:hypothetical protein
MFLFSAATFRSRLQGWLVPLAALMISDYAVTQIVWHGQYTWVRPGTWAAFSLVGLLGWTLRSKITVTRTAGAAFGGAIVFFIVSNFAVWAGDVLYPHTLTGLAACYTAAIPFFRNDVAGNLVYCAAMFGSNHLLAVRRQAAAATENA